jgi:hypothetical protein
MDKSKLRTQKAVIWWSWWDEAEHKSTPEKRIAFYDALFRYMFLGEIPQDPKDMENPKGEDWAAYDATHYFDIIDSNIGSFVDLDGAIKRKRGGQKGNSNARKTVIVQDESAETNNELENESKTNSETNKTNAFIRMKNEERRMKNEEERERMNENESSHSLTQGSTFDCPTLEMVLAVAKDSVHSSTCEPISEAFAREWFSLMATSGWRDTKGNSILPHGWRGKLAFAWRDEKRRLASEVQKARNGKTPSGASNIHHDDSVEVVNAF